MKLFFSLLVGLFLLTTPTYASPITGQNVFNAINKIRVDHHLKPFVSSKALVAASEAKTVDMTRYHYFAHRSPQGKNLWTFVGYASSYKEAGENLASGFNTTEGLINAWMNSPTHRANILYSDFAYTGIGVKDGLVSQYFAY